MIGLFLGDTDFSEIVLRKIKRLNKKVGLSLNPDTNISVIESELKKLSSLSNVNRSFVRNTVRYASKVKYDKQGRIAITPNLIKYANLNKETLIIGMVNKIEIWNPSLLAKADKESQKIDSSQFDALADKIIL